MSNIKSAFAHGKAFIPFITCGDPDLDTTAALARTMAEAGADYREILTHYSTGVTVEPYAAGGG